MRWQRERQRDRLRIEPNRHTTSFTGVVAYGFGLIVFAALPAFLALPILHHYASPVGLDVRLAAPGRGLFYVLEAGMFLASIGLRGFGKAALDARYVAWPWLIALVATIGIGVTVFTVRTSAVISGVHPGAANNNGDILAFFGVWLLTVGNAAAAVGNQAADRVALWFEPKLAAAPKASPPSSRLRP